jgi:hypothetical protein
VRAARRRLPSCRARHGLPAVNPRLRSVGHDRHARPPRTVVGRGRSEPARGPARRAVCPGTDASRARCRALGDQLRDGHLADADGRSRSLSPGDRRPRRAAGGRRGGGDALRTMRLAQENHRWPCADGAARLRAGTAQQLDSATHNDASALRNHRVDSVLWHAGAGAAVDDARDRADCRVDGSALRVDCASARTTGPVRHAHVADVLSQLRVRPARRGAGAIALQARSRDSCGASTRQLRARRAAGQGRNGRGVARAASLPRAARRGQAGPAPTCSVPARRRPPR